MLPNGSGSTRTSTRQHGKTFGPEGWRERPRHPRHPHHHQNPRMMKDQPSRPPKRKKKPDAPHQHPGERICRSFTIPGPLVGAVRTTQRQKFVDPRYHKYARFKTLVRLLANQHDIPHSIRPTESFAVGIWVSWVKRQRVDLDNVVKSVLDALWANDRRVLCIQAESSEQTGQESAIIQVEFPCQTQTEMAQTEGCQSSTRKLADPKR